MENNITKYDFRNFLLKKENSGYSQDDLIFWRNRIPLPLDLVYRLYDDRNELIHLYLDHLVAILMYSSIARTQGDWTSIDHLPDKKIITSMEQEVFVKISDYCKDSRLNQVVLNLASTLGVSDSYEVDVNRIIEALKHNGKKYSRMYIQEELKKLMISHDSILERKVGVSNNDMFGNLVCDYFNIYRSGFSDALSTIFSDLVDYAIITKDVVSKKALFNIKLNSNSVIDNNRVQMTDTLAGNIYEPFYKNSQVGVRINSKHTFIESLTQEELVKLTPLLLSMCELELNCFSDTKAKILEENREEVSRATRIRLENQ